jgi:hypothetical protein
MKISREVQSREERAFWEKTNRAYAALRANPKAWEQELEERREWEATLRDGMELRRAKARRQPGRADPTRV